MPSPTLGVRDIVCRGKGQHLSSPGGFTFRREEKHQKLKYRNAEGVEGIPINSVLSQLRNKIKASACGDQNITFNTDTADTESLHEMEEPSELSMPRAPGDLSTEATEVLGDHRWNSPHHKPLLFPTGLQMGTSILCSQADPKKEKAVEGSLIHVQFLLRFSPQTTCLPFVGRRKE